MWAVFLLLLLLLPLPPSVHAEDLGELSANPAGLSGLFGFPISQPNERDKLNKRDELVSAVPSAPGIPTAPAVPRISTAAASELKDADPATKPLHMIS